MTRVTRSDDTLPPVRRGRAVHVTVDGEPVLAYEGETVATVLLASGLRTFRHTRASSPRGPFCGMGICYECLVTINGIPNIRACQTYVTDGMQVETLTEIWDYLETESQPEVKP